MSKIGHWILEGREAVEVELLVWARWFETLENRQIACWEQDGVTVSTVFMGTDLRFGDDGPPLLFETMILGGSKCGYQRRTATYDEAMAAHREALGTALEVVVG